LTTDNECDVSNLNKIRKLNFRNPCFSYYNINSLKNKIDDLKEILKSALPEILVIAETKIDNSFSNSQFFIDNYYEPTRCDYTSASGGLIEYIKKGILRKPLQNFKLKTFESICSEITINKE